MTGVCLRVAVLYNHDEGARTDIADVAAAAVDVAGALRELGHETELAPIGGPAPVQALVARIARMRDAEIDLVFNLCEAVAGQSKHEPLVPHLLSLAGLPHTGSGPLSLGLALRKDRARVLLGAAGVPIASGVTLGAIPTRSPPLRYPLIAKLANEDASVGIDRGSVATDFTALKQQVKKLLAKYPGPVLVEEFIAGREIYVSIVGDTALPPHEIDFSAMPKECPPIVTFDAKWKPGSAEDLGSRPTRAENLHELAELLPAIAMRAFHALELSDYARIDFRVNDAGHPYVIDVNPNCDLSESAGMARAARYASWSYPRLIGEICNAAWARTSKSPEAT